MQEPKCSSGTISSNLDNLARRKSVVQWFNSFSNLWDCFTYPMNTRDTFIGLGTKSRTNSMAHEFPVLLLEEEAGLRTWAQHFGSAAIWNALFLTCSGLSWQHNGWTQKLPFVIRCQKFWIQKNQGVVQFGDEKVQVKQSDEQLNSGLSTIFHHNLILHLRAFDKASSCSGCCSLNIQWTKVRRELSRPNPNCTPSPNDPASQDLAICMVCKVW